MNVAIHNSCGAPDATTACTLPGMDCSEVEQVWRRVQDHSSGARTAFHLHSKNKVPLAGLQHTTIR